MATLNVTSLGDYIREQRESAQVSLRQLAKVAGVSNPYLSQIERGVKKP
ncbi:MAG TPA: helix-turn-helix transcriptional regulator, partial [Actinomycetes bacterium]|nr:helix-turn-helix transcriptional regulator [Actinomycetes bacterium]